jgi:hypothetical protein
VHIHNCKWDCRGIAGEGGVCHPPSSCSLNRIDETKQMTTSSLCVGPGMNEGESMTMNICPSRLSREEIYGALVCNLNKKTIPSLELCCITGSRRVTAYGHLLHVSALNRITWMIFLMARCDYALLFTDEENELQTK